MNLLQTIIERGRIWLVNRLGGVYPEVCNRTPDDLYLPPYSEDEPQPDQNPAWVDDVSETTAIRNHFVPSQSDSQVFNIRSYPADASMPARSEHFLFTNDGMQHVEERTSAILAGNEVASPREIGGFCVCGKPIRASRIRPCHICGICLCRTCGRVQPVPEGIVDIPVPALILCPTHLEMFRNEWPHWAAGSANGPVFLPPHYSIALIDFMSGEPS